MLNIFLVIRIFSVLYGSKSQDIVVGSVLVQEVRRLQCVIPCMRLMITSFNPLSLIFDRCALRCSALHMVQPLRILPQLQRLSCLGCVIFFARSDLVILAIGQDRHSLLSKLSLCYILGLNDFHVGKGENNPKYFHITRFTTPPI